MQKVTHKEAVEAAVILDKYCNQINHACDSRVCVFGALDCPFEYGCPYYCKREIVELTEKAEKLDTGDKKMKKVMEMIKKPSTNFDRITESPEALAEFIENILDACSGDIDECDVCQLGKHCNPCDGFRKIALNWLNEESDE